MEHYICELVDIRVSHVVLHPVDGARQEKVRYAHFTLHGGVRESGNRVAVHL